MLLFFLMIRRSPRSTLTDTLFPYTTLFRSQEVKDVQIVNQRMTEAVTSFISGAVPAVALWVPFDVTVRQKVEGARMLVDASAFYPEAAIVGGWAARNDYYDQNPKLVQSLIKGWVTANDYLLSHTDDAVAALPKKHYPEEIGRAH